MAMKFHPDKLNTMGEEVKKVPPKNSKVNDAYQTIKRTQFKLKVDTQ